ncbi:peptidase domain-containing ABC transporter [Frateuria sp. GZRR33]|uniref:peptidase domain-containing ABC transporter n=1 Tax=Frateuria sp. GZRR33 TaxID=3351535 RepID=UPI003EDC25E5
MFVLYGLLRWCFFNPLRRANEDQIVCAARQQSELLEAIRGVLPIKLANQQDERRARYANATVRMTNRDIGIQQLAITFNTVNQLIFGIGRVALVWIAAVQALKGRLSAGMLIAFIAYADQFIGRAVALIDKGVDFRMLKLHAERLADIAMSAPEQAGEPGWVGDPADASIELRDVSFRYAGGEPWILRNCNLRVESGASIAIAGPSGCGKTTLAKIMLGLLEPDEGEVLFGGIPIKKLGLARYRARVAAVMQDDQLFAGSIADNICFFDPQPNWDLIGAAAATASVHADIAAMPMGYQTLVGDMGSSLSGGQRQRVILARALYRRPQLLVLDEATSHLDVERERLVNAAIQQIRITRVVIAHRPETMAAVEHVISLKQGKTESVHAYH